MKIKNSGKFELQIENEKAECAYYFKDENTIVFYHTFVPIPHRGKGIAGILIKEALDFAQQHNFHILATCSAVQIYLQRHPEYISE